MEPVAPFWFKQRQGSLEPAGEEQYRLMAPQLPPAFIHLARGDNNLWTAGLRLAAEEPDVAVTDVQYDNRQDAWGAAFELYRNHLVT